MADPRSSFFTQFCVLIVFLSNLCDITQSLDLSCIEVKKEYVKLGFLDDNSAPISPIPGNYTFTHSS